VKVDVSHLFANSVTSVGFRKGSFLRAYMHDFIHELAPHLGRELVQEALSRAKLTDRIALYEGIELPEH
jgi:LysR family cys regulon transcriptional activator